MKFACLVVLGCFLPVLAPMQDPYKGQVGTEEHPVKVSAKVMELSLMLKPSPKYQSDAAKEASGAVVMIAKVGRAGNVVDLKVISGPVMLRDAALTAARQWRYQPYLLNGKPVFVQTTITVNFPAEHKIFK